MPRVYPEWTGDKLRRLKTAYYELQIRKGREAGETEARLRVPLPAALIGVIVRRGDVTDGYEEQLTLKQRKILIRENY
jgi:hypothetical protein